MAKKGLATILLVALAILASCSKGPRVLLFNNTPADLTVRLDDKSVLARIAPGKSEDFYWQPLQLIDFGTTRNLYELRGSIRVVGYYDDDAQILKVQAEKTGELYAVPAAAELPVRDLPRQPAGFPLKPVDSGVE